MEDKMKGIVFRAFERFVQNRWNEDIANDMMSLSELPSGGAYTSVGNYAHSEFLTMAVFVAQQTQTPISELVTDFGIALFYDLAHAHLEMVKSYSNPIDLLAVIESVIHRDVRKIYNNTELPRFDVKSHIPNQTVTLEYSSSRPFAGLAHGLILGCLEFYGVKELSFITRNDLTSDGTHSIFKVDLNHEHTANS